MGEYFLIVNPVKRQYISADHFHENIKFTGIFRGYHGHVVGYLLCDGPRDIVHPLFGSWVGDPVIVTGDYSAPGTAGLATTLPKRPERNLYDMATDEFEDISLQAMTMLFDEHERYWSGGLDEFLYQAMWSPDFFETLKEIAISLEYVPLREALENVIGPNWLELYPKFHHIQGLCRILLWTHRWLAAQPYEGIPIFRIGRRTFAELRQVNGRWSLLSQVRPETLDRLVRSQPQRYFVPPSGARSQSWIGTWIDEIINWAEIAELLKESYRPIAPKRLLGANIWNKIICNIDEYIHDMEMSEEP